MKALTNKDILVFNLTVKRKLAFIVNNYNVLNIDF